MNRFRENNFNDFGNFGGGTNFFKVTCIILVDECYDDTF